MSVDPGFFGLDDFAFPGGAASGGGDVQDITLTATDNEDGTGGVATVSGGQSGATNVVYYEIAGSLIWTVVDSRVGPGTVDLSLPPGNFWLKCHSIFNGITSVSNVFYLTVTDQSISGSQGPQCPINIDFSNLSDLCTLMPRRLLVSGILTQWMREHFKFQSNIDNAFLRNSLWTEDIKTTGISIDSVFKYNPAMTEYRPGIFIKPGPWKILRYGIDDRKMLRTSCTGQKYNAMCQGSHTLFCVAGESAEVEILAAEVYKELMEFGPVARKVFNFLRFVVSDVGEPAILEEATENFVVPVVVSYGAQDVWNICPSFCTELPGVQKNLWKTLES